MHLFAKSIYGAVLANAFILHFAFSRKCKRRVTHSLNMDDKIIEAISHVRNKKSNLQPKKEFSISSQQQTH